MPHTKQKARNVALLIVLAISAVILIGVIIGGVLLYRAISPLITGGESGPTLEVADVVGQTEDAALRVLRDQGLAPDVAERTQSDEQESGKVFKQNPPAGQRVKRGRKVLVWVSLGRASFTVPDLIGESIDKVQSILVKQGLTLGSITKVYYEGRPAGRVLSQHPAPGEGFTSGVTVDVVIADTTGLPHNPMPDVMDMQLATAEDLLSRANLHLAKVTYVANDSVTRGFVTKQTPAANTDSPLGARVELEVALPTAELDSTSKSLTVRVPVPTGPDEQRVRIKVYDALSSKGQVVFDETRTPGAVVEQQLDVEGKATIQIYIDNMDKPYREDRL